MIKGFKAFSRGTMELRIKHLTEFNGTSFLLLILLQRNCGTLIFLLSLIYLALASASFRTVFFHRCSFDVSNFCTRCTSFMRILFTRNFEAR